MTARWMTASAMASACLSVTCFWACEAAMSGSSRWNVSDMDRSLERRTASGGGAHLIDTQREARWRRESEILILCGRGVAELRFARCRSPHRRAGRQDLDLVCL